MMKLNRARTGSFFSVALNLIRVGEPVPYDLFINSSILEGHERFVRIFPKGDVLSPADLETFRLKYRQLYVSESQRSSYLKSLCSSRGVDVHEKTTVLKESAIHYLENLFENKQASVTTEVLVETINGCRDVVENLVDVLHDYTVDQLKDLIATLSFHDFYTYDHSINVSMYNIMIYRFLKPEAPKEEVIHAGMGGFLHDLGKIKIPTCILNKPGKLTDEEFAEIKKHPDYGLECLVSTSMKLAEGVDPWIIGRTVHEHHENFDGTGYPNRIGGDKIHIFARVTAISDFFDAITTKRAYAPPLSTEEALALMQKSNGKKIDPQIFDLFVQHTSHFDSKLQIERDLPADFDPCQPHDHLPLIESCCENQDAHGKIQLLDLKKWKDDGHIRVVDTERRAKQRLRKRMG